MGVLEIRNFTKVYGGTKKAVDGLTLDVEAGDIYGFIGHNGAGKSTTLKAVCGVLAFEEGDILVDGHSIKLEPLACKQVMAFIPDNPDLYPQLTGIQYLNFISDIYGVGKEQRNELIIKYAALFELTDNLGDIVSSYSHGMKQKLVIIGALVHKPRLLVMDEPFVGLDPKATYSMKEIMRDICAEGGAIFFS
ncbi:MAG: ABC transporter ATP-binding protein, partial [Eubacteriales bacterium]